MKIPNLEQDPTGKTWLLQSALNALGFQLVSDNWRGPKTERALEQFRQLIEGEGDWHEVIASSFADPRDVASFRRCKHTGKSDMQCFAVGDNGIGAWGANTAQDHAPMVALPRDDWKAAGKTGGAGVLVTYRDKTVGAELADTMPWKRNIKNGAGIDLNPAASKALGLIPPHKVSGVKWRWA